ncbi:MAG: HAMP domain-containing histidine kinase [Gammaproteobacteria bacterium]|nr:HAMP domain-containing histidine kinase [Gammaproteobacteria bacterium]
MLPLAALVAERSSLLERERAARAAAEAANRDKDQFIAMLSHELRNPLNAISMAVFVMEQSKIDAETGRWAEAIRRQTEHLTHIIDDLLDVTRVTTGKINLLRQPVNIGETVARSVHALTTAGKLGEHKLEIQTDTLWVDGDPTRLEQIMTNLLTNAIKYTPAGGSIRINTYGEKSQACIRVEDTGIGIPPELLPRVFDLFTQGQQGLDRTQGGLGVGLALVRRLTQLHHGRVDVESKGQDQGSIFTVRLPRIEAPAVHPAKNARVGESPKNGVHRILIVEDNPDSRLVANRTGNWLTTPVSTRI